MNFLARELHPAALRWELTSVCILAWLALVSIPLGEGGIGLSWDALNHHIYLGWTAETSRFDLDYLAASYQSYQFPYLYWPVYKLAVSGWSGAWTGAVLATLHIVAVPPVWMLAHTCIPGRTLFDVLMRSLAVTMAFISSVLLSLFDSTSNDLLAATPFVWALAFALAPLDARCPPWLSQRSCVALSGLFAGVAVAFKLSNGPLALVLPFLWLYATDGQFHQRLLHAVYGGVAILVGYLLVYGSWGSQLWIQFGNPIYPFYDYLFAPLRNIVGWTP